MLDAESPLGQAVAYTTILILLLGTLWVIWPR